LYLIASSSATHHYNTQITNKPTVALESMRKRSPLSLILSLGLLGKCHGEGTNLVGTTITRSDIYDHAAITMDLRDMTNYCDQGDLDRARDIYLNGKNAKFSLYSLADKYDHLDDDITFAFQMYGLTEGDVNNGLASNERLFASKYVEMLFNDDECILAVEASRALILWMHTVHRTWKIVQDCRKHGDPYYDNDYAGVANMLEKSDEMIAYWVGAIQGTDMAGLNGHSLFSDANKMAEEFSTETHTKNGAFVNWNIIYAYEELSGVLSSETACNANTNTIAALWPIAIQTVNQMMIPHFQHIVKAIVEEDAARIGIYARIIVPQVSQCRPSDYRFLKEHLLDFGKKQGKGTGSYDPSKKYDLLNTLKNTYSCFGILCEDVGFPSSNDSALACDYYDEDVIPTLARFPATSEVDEHSKIDLDIRQIQILTQFESAEVWAAAKYIYMHGKNSLIKDYYKDDDDVGLNTFRSLHSFANSGSRTRSTLFYKEFTEYFDEPNYADVKILEAFDNEGRYGNNGSTDQKETKLARSGLIRTALTSQVMYMMVLAKLNEAVEKCGNGAPNSPRGPDFAWDTAAAYIIGSLEGEGIGGSDHFFDGTLLWGLANERSIEFDRLNGDYYAKSNAEVETLLLSGKGQIISRNCVRLGDTAERIAHMLLVPIIQGLIKYAIGLQFETVADKWSDADMAIGETYANAIIPVFLKYDKTAAETVKRNMVQDSGVSFGELVPDGPQTVADAYLRVANDFGVGCQYIGKKLEVDACLKYVPSTATSTAARTNSSQLMMIGGGLICLISSLIL